MSTATPEELALWCQQTLPKETRAFEVLVSQYKRSVFSTAYRLMGNRQDAEDQAQEVFLKIFRGIKNLSEPATLSSWIHRITINTCLDALEKQRRRPAPKHSSPHESEEEEEPVYADTHTLTPSQQMEQTELRRCLERAISLLEIDGRGALVLRDVEGLSYEEVAEALKIGLSAVKMRIHRARLAARKLLEQVCPGVWRTGAA